MASLASEIPTPGPREEWRFSALRLLRQGGAFLVGTFAPKSKEGRTLKPTEVGERSDPNFQGLEGNHPGISSARGFKLPPYVVVRNGKGSHRHP